MNSINDCLFPMWRDHRHSSLQLPSFQSETVLSKNQFPFSTSPTQCQAIQLLPLRPWLRQVFPIGFLNMARSSGLSLLWCVLEFPPIELGKWLCGYSTHYIHFVLPHTKVAIAAVCATNFSAGWADLRGLLASQSCPNSRLRLSKKPWVQKLWWRVVEEDPGHWPRLPHEQARVGGHALSTHSVHHARTHISVL